MSLAETYRRAERYANGSCPIEAGVMGRLADRECKHGRLPGDKGEPCGCWPPQPNALKRRRLMLGYTRPRLAAEAGLSTETIRRAEAGEYVRWASVSRLAFALACDPQWLFPGHEGPAPRSWSVSDPATRRRALEMRSEGALQYEIADELGVAKSTVSRWLSAAGMR